MSLKNDKADKHDDEEIYGGLLKNGTNELNINPLETLRYYAYCNV